jgi:hypothetical protein
MFFDDGADPWVADENYIRVFKFDDTKEVLDWNKNAAVGVVPSVVVAFVVAVLVFQV